MARQPFRWSAAVSIALIVSVCWALPAVAAISLDDEASAPLTVASDGLTSLTLDGELDVAASVAVGDAQSADAGSGTNGFHFDAHASSNLESSGGSSAVGGLLVGSADGKIWNPPMPLPLPGDVNQDLCVDFADFMILQRHYGMSGATWGQGDMNGDGFVNFADFMILQRFYGDCWVPEPSSVVAWTMLIGLGLVYGYRRRRTSRGKQA